MRLLLYLLNDIMFKRYDQSQNFLIPPSYDDFLGERHEAKLLNNIIEALDLDFLYKSYKNNKLGTTAYNPVMLLKVLFYGYMNGSFSSRKIAKKLTSDLGFMFLAGNNQPDFRTINNFRRNKGELLEKVFVEIIYLASELGLIKFGTFSIDGTSIYANASKHRNIDLEQLSNKISDLFDQAERIDLEEDDEYGDEQDNISHDLTSRKKQKEAIEKARKKYKDIQNKVERENKEAEENKKTLRKNVNPTDSDSRFQKMKKGNMAQGYNCQIVTENQIILGNYIAGKPGDLDTLIPTLSKIKEKINKTPRKILADKGYASEANYLFLEENKIDSYIPHPEQKKVDVSEYTYDNENDSYKDKRGSTFILKQYVGSLKGRKRGRPRKGEILKEEDFQAKLYVSRQENGKERFLQISKNKKGVYQKNDDRLDSKKGRKLFKTRSNEVEAPFGNIKYNLGFERFLLRGLEGVQIEWNLINMAHNLKKIMKFQAS